MGIGTGFWNSEFPPADLAAHFREHAEIVSWWRAVACPCGSTPQSRASINCPACGGLGRFYPTPPQRIYAVLTQIRQEQMLPDVGLVLAGDLWADQPPWAVPLGILDIIVAPWSQPFFGELIARGQGATDPLSYRALQVSYCGIVNSVTGATTTYATPADFSVAGKVLTWVTGHGPPPGTVYTLQYDAEFEWSPVSPGMVRMERGTAVGQRTALRKRHLVLQGLMGQADPT